MPVSFLFLFADLAVIGLALVYLERASSMLEFYFDNGKRFEGCLDRLELVDYLYESSLSIIIEPLRRLL